ncbi:putative signal transducing protein [Pedobacter agri]|jgi:predicted nucleic-acid-binding Zn-ribbon protein|uniref:putative signal transducing protein n=1 Tax=Pedobacter agri TaxID=454586 RepID=UPI002931813F|nr:DUF2007 domain-containing protein [Pedobacter agri]
MNDKTIVYSTYYNPMEANIIRAKLEDSGFACFLADENVATINPLYNQAIGGVKLIVFERDVEEINKLLSEENDLEGIVIDDQVKEKPLAEELLICPKCGSENLYRLQTRNNKFNLFGIFNYRLEKNESIKCIDCGYEYMSNMKV